MTPLPKNLTPQGLDLTPRWCHAGAMDLGQYVNDLQRQLLESAENGTDDTRAVAERLVAGLDSAARLVLLDVLSAAAGEITRDLAPGSVDLRLRGREVEFVVAQASTESDGDDEPATSVDLDDVSTSRTTLRLPDALKAKVDEAAVGGRPVRQHVAGAGGRRRTPAQATTIRAAHAAHRRQLRRLGPLDHPAHTPTSHADPRGRTNTPRGRQASPCPRTPRPPRSTSPSTCRSARSRSSRATAPTPS